MEPPPGPAKSQPDQIVTGRTLVQGWIVGFNSSDKIAFSAADFNTFSLLASHMSQSGANTIIALDASDGITLYNVQASSLTSAQFAFV